nr:hypothetical protein [Garicola koreensis]
MASVLLISVVACGTGESSPEAESPSPEPVSPEHTSPESTKSEPTSPERTPDPAPELPGGGETVFPDRRLVAAYGSPDAPGLGILGEGTIDDAVDQVHQYAQDYQQFSEEPVVPAFEIIATVAAADPGPEGTYTNKIDPEVIEPWVEAAAEEEIYVILDLQPGHEDFLSQAKTYDDLLSEPHVGLALDPEWRLAEGQRHMEQIGSVDAAEINDVAQWLAELTQAQDLPQKVLMLHQFKPQMITNREDIDTSYPELAMVLHVDGHGPPEIKMDSWQTQREDLSEDFWMGWKNFYDEDFPTFTPQQTYGIDPQPWFVSYQ